MTISVRPRVWGVLGALVLMLVSLTAPVRAAHADGRDDGWAFVYADQPIEPFSVPGNQAANGWCPS